MKVYICKQPDFIWEMIRKSSMDYRDEYIEKIGITKPTFYNVIKNKSWSKPVKLLVDSFLYEAVKRDSKLSKELKHVILEDYFEEIEL